MIVRQNNREHLYPVNSVAFLPDGISLASASGNSTVKIEFKDHGTPPNFVTFSPDGNQLL